LKTWIQEAKDESKWNALISDWWESLEDEEDDDNDNEDQHTESETETPTTQNLTSLEEEDECTTHMYNFDENECTDRRYVGDKFDGVRDKMRSTFLPALIKDNIADGDPLLNLACLPVKNAGLALPNPVNRAEANYRASEVPNSHIIQVMRKKETFSLQDHTATARKVKGEIKKRHNLTNKAHLESILGIMTKDLSRTVRRGCETGAWLTVMPYTIAGTELSADEYRASLHMH
jgi:hypothetical protein